MYFDKEMILINVKFYRKKWRNLKKQLHFYLTCGRITTLRKNKSRSV